MAVTLKGKGLIWGVGGLTCTGIIAAAKNRLQTADFTQDASFAALEDESGEVAGGVFFNKKYELELSVIPSDTTIAAAKTNLDAILLAPGTLVAITDGDSAVPGGNYMVSEKGSKLRRTNKGMAIVDVSLIRYNADISTTISS